MTHENLKFMAGGLWRELPDNENTEKYLMKLSHASTVYVLFDSGEAWQLDCGVIVKSSLFASTVIPQKTLAELTRAQFNRLTNAEVSR